jgi:monoterpene epsilon-lactone hydrolase
MSIQLFVADKILRLTVKREFGRDPDVFRLRPMMKRAENGRVPARIAVQQIALGGVPTEKLTPDNASVKHAIFYIHGGGWVGGKPSNHRALTWRLAEKLGCAVYAVDYRLAPENPFPAGLEDCETAYRALLESGFAPSGLAVGGDSAGGNLTLALAQKLKISGLPQPAAFFALSPATELGTPLASHTANARVDAMFDTRIFASRSVIHHYCPNADLSNPLISPLRGDPTGQAPTLIQVSRDEMLRDDSVEMAAKLRAAGVEVELEVWPKVFHVWQIMADVIPESRKAIENIVTFVKKHWKS